jgi:hypothetical protein
LEVELKKRTIFLLYTLFILVISLNTSAAFAYVATLSWYAPTTNADGTPLTDLAGYYVYYGTQSQNYDHKTKVVGNEIKYTVTNLADGAPYYCAVTAYDTSGNESKPSNEVSIIRYTLTVNKSGTGEGTVTSSPSGINCGSDCKEAYKSGTVVTLSATADTGSNFTGWSGGGCEGNGQCVVTINATKTVAANFSAVSTPTTIILDNRDNTTSKIGTWSVSSGTNPYGSDSIYGRDGARFTWHFKPSKSGRYRVTLWWTERESRSKHVPVIIEHKGGKTKVHVNQTKNGGKWNFLGKYHFKKGVTYAITITAQSYSTTTCADAIRFKLVQ